MKRFFQVFFFLFSIIIFSQEENEEYSVFNFEKNTSQKILIDKTKLRTTPDVNSVVLDSLDINQEIKEMIFNHMDRIVFAGDSVTDMESAQPVGEGLFENVGKSYVRIVENMLAAFADV